MPDRVSAQLFPGSMGLVGLCCELLGVEHVIPGEWLQPVTVTDVRQEDIDAIIELAKEGGVELTAREIANP